MKKWLVVLVAVFSLSFSMAQAGPLGGSGSGSSASAPSVPEEQEIYYCWFTSQVVNIDDFLGFDQFGSPEPMARVDLGYYYYDFRTRSYKGVSTFYVIAGGGWMPTLRGAYFDPRRPSVSVSTESDQKCYSGPYRGWLTYVRSNPNATYDWYPDYGYGKE